MAREFGRQSSCRLLQNAIGRGRTLNVGEILERLKPGGYTSMGSYLQKSHDTSPQKVAPCFYLKVPPSSLEGYR